MNKNSSLGKNAALNALKQACAILFPLITFTYSNRILGKDNVGIYSFGNSIISYIVLLAGLGISTYAVREGSKLRDNKNKLNEFANEVFSINVISMMFSYIVLIGLLLFWPKLKGYETIIAIQSISVLLNVVGADWINTIEEDYYYLTIRYIIIQLVSLVFLFVFVRTIDDLYAYAIICVLSNTGGNIFNILYIRKYVKLHIKLDFNWWFHLKPMLILFSSSVASVIYLNSDITILDIMTSDSETGIYTVASKSYQLLKTLINAIVLVTIPRFSYYISNNHLDKYQETYKKLSKTLLYLVLPCSVGLFMKSENIICLVGGEEYVSGKTALRILSFAFVFAVAACLFCHSVLIPNKLEKKYLIATIISALLNIILNIFLIPYWGLNATAITTLIAEIVMFFIAYIYSRKIIKTGIKWHEIIRLIIGCIGIVLVCCICSRLFSNIYVDLFVSIVLSAPTYYLLTYLLKYPTSLEIVQLLSKIIKMKTSGNR